MGKVVVINIEVTVDLEDFDRINFEEFFDEMRTFSSCEVVDVSTVEKKK